ncbi:MAG: short-chain dehydrogenase/reductase [Acidimicrobiia bacterium]|nr:short-chain dehydrogenase/reductase [Acidimicrobiia bacterium]
MTATDNTPVPDYQHLLRLDGKNLVVAGAGQGMGRQSSHALAQCGANVMCVDIVDVRAREVAEEVHGVAYCGDMTRESEVIAMVEQAKLSFGGPIHGFIDIIGIAEWIAVSDMAESVWDSQFDMCLRHAYLLSKHIGKHMIDSGTAGTMVFIASVHGLTASVRHAAYGAAKAGLISLVRTIADEMGGAGIRANAIAPGSILTPRMEIALDEERRREAGSVAPLGRMGLTSEIASAALFLTSDLSSYVTGHTLVVDGGVVIADPYKNPL